MLGSGVRPGCPPTGLRDLTLFLPLQKGSHLSWWHETIRAANLHCFLLDFRCCLDDPPPSPVVLGLSLFPSYLCCLLRREHGEAFVIAQQTHLNRCCWAGNGRREEPTGLPARCLGPPGRPPAAKGAAEQGDNCSGSYALLLSFPICRMGLRTGLPRGAG